MATWVTHLMIADSVLQHIPSLDRRGFCVGNIAPDCNVENEDWTAFTPSREVTHWMQGERNRNWAGVNGLYEKAFTYFVNDLKTDFTLKIKPIIYSFCLKRLFFRLF